MPKQYHLIHLGRKNHLASEFIENNLIGINCDVDADLSYLKDSNNWTEFREGIRPLMNDLFPNLSKGSIGQKCGVICIIVSKMLSGDIVLVPTNSTDGVYRYGEIVGEYKYDPQSSLPHQRSVKWLGIIKKEDMSQGCKNSLGAIKAAFEIYKYADEIEDIINGNVTSSGETEAKQLADFALEKHLEDFLVQNWSSIEQFKDYNIYTTEDNEQVGKQFNTNTVGIIDVLAKHKSKAEWLVIELKNGKSSDMVVGQILRYMGYIKNELADEGDSIKGVIITGEDDLRIKYATQMLPSVDFYQYQISFQIKKNNL